jgi:FAD/FMN-containing dehydrogenase/Fe-S oxidoreductase
MNPAAEDQTNLSHPVAGAGPDLPPSSHGVPTDSFREAAALERELRAKVKGDVRFDRGSRAAYAADASNYRQFPIGVVIPKDEADIIAAVGACRKFKAPILSRGGGTSLAGQACNVAVILDFSKYCHRILALDPKARIARVQSGVVLDTLRDAAEAHRLTFAPDPSTHNRCTIGGMIGNNSSGPHGLMGGKVQDNVIEMRVLLYDGTILTVGPTTPGLLDRIIAEGGRRGGIYAGLKRLRDRYGEQVREKFAKIPRRVSGYNFDELLPETEFNVARALVGSEGTCMIVLDATLRLIPSPPFKSLVCLAFQDIYVAADAVPAILESKPIALEGFEGDVLNVMRRKNLQPENISLFPPGGGYLLVEFGGDTATMADAEADEFAQRVLRWPGPPAIKVVREKGEVARVWKVREASNGATAVIPGGGGAPGEHATIHTHEGWEDAGVHPRVLGPYLRAYRALLNQYGFQAWFYGHFGEGVVHQRVTFDLESVAGLRIFRKFLEEAADLVVQFGGSISGEHGDGHGRAFLYEKMFGPDLVRAFREFKTLWDPEGGLNPGKIVDPYPPEAFLRLGADYRPKARPSHFQFPDDDGSLEIATQRCVGVGACRKLDAGTMCPSYQVTREEIHSTRGRAHLLFEMLQGEILKDGWRNREVKESLDLCLACKGCKTECPTNVDIATYKSEFLSHHYEGRLRPIRHLAFGYIDQWARLASFAPRPINALSGLFGIRHGVKKALGLAPQRKLPPFAEESFVRWLRRQSARPTPRRGEVVLFADTFNNYFHPAPAQAAWEVLVHAGYSVHVPQTRQHLCCGRPLYDFGLLDSAVRYLRRVLDILGPQIDAGLPVIMLEPSCASVFRDELRNLLPNDARGARLRQQTVTLSEFLESKDAAYEPPKLTGRKAVLHGHCHHKSVLKFATEEALLRRMGVVAKSLDSGCCGMAGPFGFERDKFEISQALGERVLLPAVRAAGEDTLVITDGFSCREQITQNTSRQPLHIAEVVRMALRPVP